MVLYVTARLGMLRVRVSKRCGLMVDEKWSNGLIETV